MRHYLIARPGDAEPFVLAESPDKGWILDAPTYLSSFTLSHEEAALDDDFRNVVRAWNQGRDWAYDAWAAIEAAGIAAAPELHIDLLDRDAEAGSIVSDPHARIRTELMHAIWLVNESEGPAAAAAFARHIARQAAEAARDLDPTPVA